MNALDNGFTWFLRGEVAIGSGWVSRARRLLADQPDCAERGFLIWLDATDALEAGDLPAVLAAASEMHEIGRRFAAPTLTSLALVFEGMVCIHRGGVDKGFALLDEAMLPVLAGQIEPEWAGNIYCQLMSVCHDLGDVRRARQWTVATERWCDTFASAAMFVGICRIHRVQLLQLRGDWTRAEREASIACEELAQMNVMVVPEAHYQLAELRRLRDDLPGAEVAYLRARELGREPQPGLALLCLARGDADNARVMVVAALAQSATRPFHQARLLVAHVEIALACGDVKAAASASEELGGIAGRYATAAFRTWTNHVRGSVLLATRQPADAVATLRDAHQGYREMEAPYDAATIQVLIAQACEMLGNTDAARAELDAAAAAFSALGAAAQVRRLAELRGSSGTRAPAALPGGLTVREVEVLTQIAAGATNRQAAAALFISEKTVARHLANIFTKLGLSSRTAAAAWAYEHHLTRLCT